MTTGDSGETSGAGTGKEDIIASKNMDSASFRNLLQDSVLETPISHDPFDDSSSERLQNGRNSIEAAISSVSHNMRLDSSYSPQLVPKITPTSTDLMMTGSKVRSLSPIRLNFGGSNGGQKPSLYAASTSSTPPSMTPVQSTPIRDPVSNDVSPTRSNQDENAKVRRPKNVIASPEVKQDKCINFLKALLQLSQSKGRVRAPKKLHKLVQDVINGSISMSWFKVELKEVLNSNDDQRMGQIIVLLEELLPDIRMSMAKRHVVIPGIKPPTFESIARLNEKLKKSTVTATTATAKSEILASTSKNGPRSIVIQNVTRPLSRTQGLDPRPPSRSDSIVIKKSTNNTQTGVIHHFPEHPPDPGRATDSPQPLPPNLESSGITVKPTLHQSHKPKPVPQPQPVPQPTRTIRPKQNHHNYNFMGPAYMMPSTSTPVPQQNYSQLYDHMAQSQQQPFFLHRNQSPFVMGHNAPFADVVSPPPVEKMLPLSSPHLSYVTSGGNIAVQTPPNGMARIQHNTNPRQLLPKRLSPSKLVGAGSSDAFGAMFVGYGGTLTSVIPPQNFSRRSSGGKSRNASGSKGKQLHSAFPPPSSGKKITPSQTSIAEKPRTEIEELNDVMLMGGINVAEEAQIVFCPSSEPEFQKLQSPQSNVGLSGLEKFFNEYAIRKRAQLIANRRGVDRVSSEVLALIAAGLNDRLRSWLAKLAAIAEHRMESPSMRWNSRYKQTTEVREQLKFLDEVDKADYRIGRDREREQLIKLSAKKVKELDDGQALRSKAKELQKQQENEQRNCRANEAALQALGGNRKRPWDATKEKESSENDGLFVTPVEPSTSFDRRMHDSAVPGIQVGNRAKRVALKDVQVLLSTEREHRMSGMLYR